MMNIFKKIIRNALTTSTVKQLPAPGDSKADASSLRRDTKMVGTRSYASRGYTSGASSNADVFTPGNGKADSLRQKTKMPNTQSNTVREHGSSSSAHGSTKKSPPHRNPNLKKAQIVQGWGEGGCVVCAVAGASGHTYGSARAIAVEHGFAPNKGWFFSGAVDALQDLGVEGSYHAVQPGTWSQFPDRALVGVKACGTAHAVVLEGDYIYDNLQSQPVHRDNYSIYTTSSYISY